LAHMRLLVDRKALKVLTAESLVLTIARRPIGIAAVIASPRIALLRAQERPNMHHSKLLDRKFLSERLSSLHKFPELSTP
jgi:hypothetical protein